jgi:galactokinase
MSAHSDRASEGYGRWLEIFVPGRICLMGEHSDWAGSYRRFNRDLAPGMCLVSGTNQGMYARVRPHPHKLIVSSVDHAGNKYGPIELLMDPEVLLKAAASGDSYFSYIFGVAYQIAVRYNCRGLVIENYKTDLPQAKGLSSSAAATVLAARAFNRVYDLKLSVRGEMDLAYHGEITTPSQCGRMDQCCAFGARPVLMKFDGDLLECEELTLGAPLYIVIVELAGSKDTTTILQRLTKCFPVADNDEQTGLQNLLGAINTRIINAGIEALAAGDVQRLGELMTEAQALFDRYATPICPSQLTAPNLHKILQHEPLKPHIWGAKGVGSQGDGRTIMPKRVSATGQRIARALPQSFVGLC